MLHGAKYFPDRSPSQNHSVAIRRVYYFLICKSIPKITSRFVRKSKKPYKFVEVRDGFALVVSFSSWLMSVYSIYEN